MMTSQPKILYRSDTDKRISGVCGGIAAYLEADPTAIRLAWILITIFTGIVPGIVAYILAAIIMPRESDVIKQS